MPISRSNRLISSSATMFPPWAFGLKIELLSLLCFSRASLVIWFSEPDLGSFKFLVYSLLTLSNFGVVFFSTICMSLTSMIWSLFENVGYFGLRSIFDALPSDFCRRELSSASYSIWIATLLFLIWVCCLSIYSYEVSTVCCKFSFPTDLWE